MISTLAAQCATCPSSIAQFNRSSLLKTSCACARSTRERAVAQGFSLVDQTKLVTAASELARNTLEYGGGGEVTIEVLNDGMRKGVRLTFSDHGPGIADIDLALKDGYTTGGGLGLGLSGAKRLSNEFSIESRPGEGTRVRLRAGADASNRLAPQPMQSQTLLQIDESSQVGHARRAALDLARKLGFDEEQAGKVGLAVNECASNILKHAGRGAADAPADRTATASDGIEVIALDKGPGIADVAASLRDGHSTSGTLGGGSARCRGSPTRFEIFTQPGKGTAVRLALWARPIPDTWQPIEFGGICVPIHGEPVSGDDWSVELWRDQAVVLLADGLGHGIQRSRGGACGDSNAGRLIASSARRSASWKACMARSPAHAARPWPLLTSSHRESAEALPASATSSPASKARPGQPAPDFPQWHRGPHHAQTAGIRVPVAETRAAGDAFRRHRARTGTSRRIRA